MSLNRERILREFLSLCRISSPSKNERLIADYLKVELSKLGFIVTEDDTGEKIGGNTGNIIALKKGNLVNAPVLMFSAHMDTVNPCNNVNPIVKEDCIYSDGTTVLGSDDKAGIAAIMESLRVIQENNLPHGDLEIIFSVCEEVGITGAKFVDVSSLRYNCGYVLDAGGSPANMIIAAPAQDTFTVKIHGRASHAGSSPEKGINAIIVASTAIVRMHTGRIDEETTSNVGAIQGGSATNIVPDYVEIKCEARSRNEEKLEHQTKHMLEVFEATAKEFSAGFEVDYRREFNSFRLEKNEAVMQFAVKGAEKKGLPLISRDGGGGSDANIYNAKGKKTLVLGVGMDDVHSVNEKMLIKDLYKATEHVLGIIEAAAEAVK